MGQIKSSAISAGSAISELVGVAYAQRAWRRLMPA